MCLYYRCEILVVVSRYKGYIIVNSFYCCACRLELEYEEVRATLKSPVGCGMRSR